MLVVATRSADKLRELRNLLAREVPAELVTSLHEIGVEPDTEEDSLEVFDSFDENAAAKARYFARKTRLLTLADDSGLCVDALGGQPGVRSKRFSSRNDLHGTELDNANTELLLRKLQGVPTARRTASYVCVLALAFPEGREELFRGTCPGSILVEPRGHLGFGYDPVFVPAGHDLSFGELSAARKNEFSHRHRAVEAARFAIRAAVARDHR